jgi:hypothetical protein
VQHNQSDDEPRGRDERVGPPQRARATHVVDWLRQAQTVAPDTLQ